MFLLTLTSAVNTLCLIAAFWLAFFVLTRGSRRRVSQLASATLWATSAHLLSQLTFIYGPRPGTALPWWWGWGLAVAAALLWRLWPRTPPGSMPG